VIVENKRWTASVHYRVAAPSIVPELTVRVAEIAEAQGLKVTHAKKTLEIRPPITINKGTAAIELARSLDAFGDGASLLVAGDDRTDEDMFRVVRPSQPSAVTVWVAHELPEFETAAEFTVSSTEELRQLLESIVRHRRGGPMVSAV
jgi:alpha,alpha-trehalase